MAGPPKKPLMGILLYPTKTIPLGKIKTTEYYEFRVGKNVPGMQKKGVLFISTPAIQERIEELRLKPGHRVGWFEYMIGHEFRMIALNGDYPTCYDPRLEKLGIGTMAENLLEKKYAKLYPTYQSVGTWDDNPLRRAQRRKRGLDMREGNPIGEAQELTRKYVIKKHQEWMAKNRRPPPRRT